MTRTKPAPAIGRPATKCPDAPVRDSMPRRKAKTRATAERRGKKCHSCKPLPKEFRRHGFAYRQIIREGNTAVYEQVWIDCSNREACFEVIRVRRRDAFTIGETFIEAYEVYPRPESWGEDAFTVIDLDTAFAKLKKLAADAVNHAF